MDRIFIHCVALPGVIKGLTRLNSDDDYLVFINANLCEDAQKKVLAHELRHIQLGHFRSWKSIGEDERQASAPVKQSPSALQPNPAPPPPKRVHTAVPPSSHRNRELRLPKVSARERKRAEAISKRLDED